MEVCIAVLPGRRTCITFKQYLSKSRDFLQSITDPGIFLFSQRNMSAECAMPMKLSLSTLTPKLGGFGVDEDSENKTQFDSYCTFQFSGSAAGSRRQVDAGRGADDGGAGHGQGVRPPKGLQPPPRARDGPHLQHLPDRRLRGHRSVIVGGRYDAIRILGFEGSEQTHLGIPKVGDKGRLRNLSMRSANTETCPSIFFPPFECVGQTAYKTLDTF